MPHAQERQHIGSHARDLYDLTRERSRKLVLGLRPEDMVVQSMEDASPTKWHLAHTSWFFEQFILREHVIDYRSPDDRFAFLFNSYYVQAGPRHARSRRGLITRPMQAYGLPNALRISVGLAADNRAVADALGAFVAR